MSVNPVEVDSRTFPWEVANFSSVMVRSQPSIESSKSPIKPYVSRILPSHSSPVFPYEKPASYLIDCVSPMGKGGAEFGSRKERKTTVHSRVTPIGKVLLQSSIEYHPVIYRDIVRSISESNRAVALNMLRWVAYAARSLHTGELLDAISSQTNIHLEERDIERICGGLLSITEDMRVCLVHLSLRDYLSSQREKDDMLGWNTESGTTHEMITCVCIRQLSPEDLIDRSFVFSADIRDESRLTFNLYARQYWRFHYSHAENQSSYLAGMLHEKLKTSWEKGCETIAAENAQIQNSHITSSQNSSSRGPVNIVDAILREAARSGMKKLAKMELEMGASPNASDNLEMTALHYAAVVGNCDIIQLLIDYGGEFNLTSKSGETSFSLAVANRHVEVVKLLQAHDSPSARHPTGIFPNENEKRSQLDFRQKLFLTVLITSHCSDCRDKRTHYFLSKPPDNETCAELWPPIRVVDQSASQAKCTHSAMQENSQMCHGTLISEQRTMVKWFPGINMYKALGIAATSGMDDVLKLLLLAGNDVGFLKGNASLSKLMSAISIS